MQEDFLPVEGSLLCRYKGMTRCNEQMVKLGKFGREVEFFSLKWLKMCSGFCYLKSLKEDRLFFPWKIPRFIQVLERWYRKQIILFFRTKRIRIGIYLAFIYTMSVNSHFRRLNGYLLYLCRCYYSCCYWVEYKMFVLSTIYKTNSFFQSKLYCLQLSLTFR